MSADNGSGAVNRQGCLRAVYTENRTPPATPEPCRAWADRVIIGLALLSLLFIAWHPDYIVSTAVFRWSMLFVDGYFILDYILRIIYTGRQSSNGKETNDWLWKLSSNHYIKRWYGLADLATAVAGVCAIIISLFPESIALAEYAAVPRLLRLFRIGRVIHHLRNIIFLNRWLYVLEGAGSFSKKIYREIIISIIGIMIVVLLCSWIIMSSESEVNASFGDYFRTLIWSIFSLFGQSDPEAVVTLYSKLTAILIVFAGLVLIGVLTGSITTLLQDKVDRGARGQLECKENKHLLICGWNTKLRDLLLLISDGKVDIKSVVLLFDRGNEEEENIPRKWINRESGQTIRIQWVRGNPRSIDDLEKASYRGAAGIIVLADHGGGIRDELDVDARTLMAVHSLSSGRRKSTDHKRKISLELFTISGYNIATNPHLIGDGTELRPVYADEEVAKILIGVDRELEKDGKALSTSKNNQAPALKYMPRVLVCGWNWTVPEIAKELAEKYKKDKLEEKYKKEQILFLFDLGHEKSEEAQELQDATWQKGNPRNINDLKRFISDALEKVIILADRSGKYENQLDVDARTLMTLQNIDLLIKEEKSIKIDVTIEIITNEGKIIAENIKDQLSSNISEAKVILTDEHVADLLLKEPFTGGETTMRQHENGISPE